MYALCTLFRVKYNVTQSRLSASRLTPLSLHSARGTGDTTPLVFYTSINAVFESLDRSKFSIADAAGVWL